MKPTVYLETSIIGYLTSRPSELIVTAANQQLTHKWWGERRQDYELLVSHFVVAECAAGDAEAAAERLALIMGLPVLDVSEDVRRVAEALMAGVPLPEKAQADAIHLAVTAVHGIQYLLTLNCKHIANPSFQRRIDVICRQQGYEPPTICTPQEILEL